MLLWVFLIKYIINAFVIMMMIVYISELLAHPSNSLNKLQTLLHLLLIIILRLEGYHRYHHFTDAQMEP